MQRIRIALPALLILSTFILAAPMLALAIDVAPRITDREIVERLTRLEEGQKFMIKHFEQRFDDMNQRITEQHQTMLTMFSTLIALIIALFGYIAWDRRTMFRPIKERLERIEQELEIMPDRPPRSSTPRARRPADSAPPDSAAHGAARA